VSPTPGGWLISAPGRRRYAVLQVSQSRRLDRPDLLQRQVGADALEQPGRAAEHQRDDVQLELVDESGRQVLVDDIGTAADRDVLTGGRRPKALRAKAQSCRLPAPSPSGFSSVGSGPAT